jgi:hypothetical protein
MMSFDIYSYLLWFSWIWDQQESEGVTPGEDVYIILRLDGRVRRSGIVIILCSQFTLVQGNLLLDFVYVIDVLK